MQLQAPQRTPTPGHVLISQHTSRDLRQFLVRLATRVIFLQLRTPKADGV
jgi:hypothetical protein